MKIPAWADFFKYGLDVLFRSQCPLCDRTSAQFFCPDCTRRLLGCQCDAPAIRVPDLPPLYSWGTYEGPLKQTLAKLKYSSQPRIAEPLGQWLAQCWLDLPHAKGLNGLVVPIPLHGDRQRERGYNQADLIARSFCQATGLPLKSYGLIRTQATTAQYGLTRGDRFRNLQNVFSLGPDLYKTNPRPILLIDDIFTTGATCKSAIATLNQHGFQVIAIFTVAVTER